MDLALGSTGLMVAGAMIVVCIHIRPEHFPCRL